MRAGADPDLVTPLARLLPPDGSRFVAATPSFMAVPTFACFVSGYLLIVPPAHVPSFGDLGPVELAGAEDLIGALTGLLAGHQTEDGSYIAVRDQDERLRVYTVPSAAEAHQRIQLRRKVATLGPRVDDDAWDWVDQLGTELSRATVEDLVAGSGGAVAKR